MLIPDESPVEIGFASAAAADRRIAGVAAAARAVKMLADGGASNIRLLLADDAAPSPGTLADIERMGSASKIEIVHGVGPAATVPSAWQIIRQTGKLSDGLVSRWLNRPISQRISWMLLRLFPSIRPAHVTLFNALLAFSLIPVLTFGAETGLILGGVMFHAASVLDGVDGEIARATWRTSARGATLDSVIDIATNLLFVAGLTINLALRDGGLIGWVGAWALMLSMAGGALIASRSHAANRSIGFDMLKRREHRVRGPFDLLYWAVQTLTGRDCFAFLFMTLILFGFERIALFIYVDVGTIWLTYVVIVLALPRPRPSARIEPGLS